MAQICIDDEEGRGMIYCEHCNVALKTKGEEWQFEKSPGRWVAVCLKCFRELMIERANSRTQRK